MNSNKLTSPPRRAPNLPPEILQEIFTLVIYDRTPLDELDLFACSLVCTSWHTEARPLLTHHLLADFRWGSRTPNGASLLVRAVDQLAESFRSGLHYAHHVTELTINVNILINHGQRYRPNCTTAKCVTMKAYCNLMRMAPNLRKLNIDLYHCHKLSTHAAHIISQFLTRNIYPLCSGITALTLSNVNQVPHTKFLDDFLSCLSSSPNLTHLETHSLHLNRSLQGALRMCTSTQTVQIAANTLLELATVIPSWPRLRTLRVTYISEGVSALLLALAAFCPNLEELRLSSGRGDDLSVHAVQNLLQTCQRLRVLVLLGMRVDQDPVHAMAMAHPTVERLELGKRTYFVGSSSLAG
ncbi:hypothetical protein BC936DRAFT_143696 [Jimgerdemannia flammicorona]|uniref:F-box domain-containing protein n=1 Tax=Jimgerdemannia flammicorona TaxID=994334 RepID=A0A433DDH7_9FUNG|nr:hypothetical protein BC936DRAFT_143696 [Jimgerdemannia flammicorona]